MPVPAPADSALAPPPTQALAHDDRLGGLLKTAVAQRTLGQGPTGAPAVAISGATQRPLVQRTEESAALLTELATPQIKPGPTVAVQKALVKKLDVDHADVFAGGIINLGGILLDELPETDEELIEEAELVPLPTSGGFISAGGLSRTAKIKEHGFDRLVIENTLRTMIDAKQIAYLRLAGLPNAEWKILIELHYYRERDMSTTGFHKDTLGETLFVNLNYHMDKTVIGPEVVVNPPTSGARDDLLPGRLPTAFLEDLIATRETLGDPTEYQAGLVAPYGYVAFVDEAVHHATPFHGHRYVTGGDLKTYLETTYPAAFQEASAAYPKYLKRGFMSWLSSFSAYVDSSIISATDGPKWLARMQIVSDPANEDRRLTRVDLKAAMSAAEFDDLLDVVGAATPKRRTQGAAAGFHAASIPGSELLPIRPTGRPPLKRRLSDADFRKTLPTAPTADEKRRFFRTWIRVVPAAKAEDLRRRLAPTTVT